MSDFSIKQHEDYHGDPICFSIIDEHGHEFTRYPSEEEAIDMLPVCEALAEDEQRRKAKEASNRT
jgi:hypothetical protein